MQHFRTDDPGEFQEFVSVAAPGTQITALERSTFSAQSSMITLPRSALFSVRAENLHVVAEGPCGFLGVTVALDESFQVASYGKVKTFRPGTAHILNPSDGFDFRQKQSGTVLVADVFPPLLDGFVARLNGVEAAPPLHLADHISLQSSGGRSLWRYLSFLWSEAKSGHGALSSKLAAKELEASLLTLLVFAVDEQLGGLLDPEEDDCPPAYLRRAEDYIASRLTNPVSLGDIAHAAGVSARTLTRAFRKRHGISPIAFLRQLRLESVQRELLVTDPAYETVTNIAFKYGFHDLGRFAIRYREAFGESPSTTLGKCSVAHKRQAQHRTIGGAAAPG